MIRATYTYAILEVSPAAFAEIKGKLHAAGYDHAFGEDDGAPVIDMHGIALKAAEREWPSSPLNPTEGSPTWTLRYVVGEGWLLEAEGQPSFRLVDERASWNAAPAAITATATDSAGGQGSTGSERPAPQLAAQGVPVPDAAALELRTGGLSMNWNVNLGDKIRDRITGLTGICTGRVEYLYGCRSVVLSPVEHKDGKVVEATWLDEGRVEVVAPAQIERPASAAVRAGGPPTDAKPPARV